ncbi:MULTISPECIES: hypothetical protein [Burkholderia]|uniref:hypothetical protein n=1 Tax=Burkholderia TaxID=32008 RepID=UPI000841A7C8|nr:MULTISPECIES: hypothetical protein [unclassified Burkholderia]AOK32289.1 hypothetical protein AQ611_22895 [Burkholderia sp. Bp7605]
MTTDIIAVSLDGYRAGCDAGLGMLSSMHDWRLEWLRLQARAIERDCAATRSVRAALATAADWRAFVEANQKTLHDYLNASAAIWQQASEMSVRMQHDWAAAVRDWTQNAQADGLRRWSSAFERPAAEAAVAIDAAPAELLPPLAPLARAGRRADRGEAHAH